MAGNTNYLPVVLYLGGRMSENKNKGLTIVAYVLVVLMIAIQAFYGVYAFIDPVGFSELRGTALFAVGDSDWVLIYASRTLFVALIIAYLLYMKNYLALVFAALFGLVMPVTDAALAYEAAASSKIVLKHAATAIYLIVTAIVLKALAKSQEI